MSLKYIGHRETTKIFRCRRFELNFDIILKNLCFDCSMVNVLSKSQILKASEKIEHRSIAAGEENGADFWLSHISGELKNSDFK